MDTDTTEIPEDESAAPPAVPPADAQASVPTLPAPIIDPRTGLPTAPLWE